MSDNNFVQRTASSKLSNSLETFPYLLRDTEFWTLPKIRMN